MFYFFFSLRMPWFNQDFLQSTLCFHWNFSSWGLRFTPTQSDSDDVPGRSGSVWILLGNALEVSQRTHKNTNSPRAGITTNKDKNEETNFVWLPCSGGQGSLACCSPWVVKSWTQLSDWTICRGAGTGYRYLKAETSRKIIKKNAAAAKSRQSCPTLCNPIDGSPPGSPIHGILQARTLERVAISFSNAWKWKVKVKSLSRVQLLAIPWTAAYQAPPSMGLPKQEYWSGLPLPSPIKKNTPT